MADRFLTLSPLRQRISNITKHPGYLELGIRQRLRMQIITGLKLVTQTHNMIFIFFEKQ